MHLSESITTLTFFRFQGFRDQSWAFGMMQFAHLLLKDVKGLRFYKLMGSGAGDGFHPFPDWSVYSVLCVWETESHARTFFRNSTFFQKYRDHTHERWTVFMKSIVAKGEWSGQNPFSVAGNLDAENPLISIITRATIRWRHLPVFWKYVPTSSLPLDQNKGLIYTKGIGEVPLVQMATFSIWKDLDSVKKFAYESKEHRVAIEKTRRLNWYKEELFSRFQPYLSFGTWNGSNPLMDYLPGGCCHHRHEGE